MTTDPEVPGSIPAGCTARERPWASCSHKCLSSIIFHHQESSGSMGRGLALLQYIRQEHVQLCQVEGSTV